MVAAQPGITLQALLHHHATSADAIYGLIATARIYVDLDAVPLAEPARVPLFPDRDTALAYAHVHATPSCASAHGIALACGTLVSWDGQGLDDRPCRRDHRRATWRRVGMDGGPAPGV